MVIHQTSSDFSQFTPSAQIGGFDTKILKQVLSVVHHHGARD